MPRASSSSSVRACTAKALVMLGMSVRSSSNRTVDATEREFTRQHQAGGSGADHDDIASVHDAGW